MNNARPAKDLSERDEASRGPANLRDILTMLTVWERETERERERKFPRDLTLSPSKFFEFEQILTRVWTRQNCEIAPASSV